MNGKLTEVLLRLTVTFQIEDRQGNKMTEPSYITASRTYQYDVATVNTDNQQEAYLNRIIIDDLPSKLRVKLQRIVYQSSTINTFMKLDYVSSIKTC